MNAGGVSIKIMKHFCNYGFTWVSPFNLFLIWNGIIFPNVCTHYMRKDMLKNRFNKYYFFKNTHKYLILWLHFNLFFIKLTRPRFAENLILSCMPLLYLTFTFFYFIRDTFYVSTFASNCVKIAKQFHSCPCKFFIWNKEK